MTVVSGAQWTGVIVTKSATGALSAATVGPVGTLYINGVVSLAAVGIAGANPYTWTVTLPALADGDCVSMYITATIALVATAGVVAEDVASTVYLSSRSTLTQANILSDATPFPGANINAAITSRAQVGDAMALTGAERTATAGVVDTELSGTHGAGSWETATGFAVPGSAMTLEAGERTTLAMVIWNTLTSALTTAGSIARYIIDLPTTIWNYLTRTLTSSDSSIPGLGLTERVWRVVRGDTLSHTFAAIPADGSITKAQVTVKTTPEQQSDTEAILAVDTVSGLLRLNGDAPGTFTASFALLTGVFLVPAATMAQLATPKRRYWYDVQVWRGTAVQTIAYGRLELLGLADVTRTVVGAS